MCRRSITGTGPSNSANLAKLAELSVEAGEQDTLALQRLLAVSPRGLEEQPGIAIGHGGDTTPFSKA